MKPHLLNLSRKMHLGLVGSFSWFGLIIQHQFMAVFPLYKFLSSLSSNKENPVTTFTVEIMISQSLFI